MRAARAPGDGASDGTWSHSSKRRLGVAACSSCATVLLLRCSAALVLWEPPCGGVEQERLSTDDPPWLSGNEPLHPALMHVQSMAQSLYFKYIRYFPTTVIPSGASRLATCDFCVRPPLQLLLHLLLDLFLFFLFVIPPLPPSTSSSSFSSCPAVSACSLANGHSVLGVRVNTMRR